MCGHRSTTIQKKNWTNECKLCQIVFVRRGTGPSSAQDLEDRNPVAIELNGEASATEWKTLIRIPILRGEYLVRTSLVVTGLMGLSTSVEKLKWGIDRLITHVNVNVIVVSAEFSSYNPNNIIA
jgi:hypothetical protein